MAEQKLTDLFYDTLKACTHTLKNLEDSLRFALPLSDPVSFGGWFSRPHQSSSGLR
jgi:hypothetical protein